MELSQLSSYNIDICFVIDATGSMSPIIDEVKSRVLSLHQEIINGMQSAHKPINKLRVKVVDYADFATEGDDAIHQTAFFDLPEETDKLEAAVRGISLETAPGSGMGKGGDAPENGLEALFIAMNSDWTPLSSTQKGRHVIVVLTDAPPLNLQERDGCIGYEASEYPGDVKELEALWAEEESSQGSKMLKISKAYKRLVLFTPDGVIDGRSWGEVEQWENTTHTAVSAADGLKGVNLDDIIAEIVRSV